VNASTSIDSDQTKRPSATACTEAFAVVQALTSFEAEPNKGRNVKDPIWKFKTVKFSNFTQVSPHGGGMQ